MIRNITFEPSEPAAPPAPEPVAVLKLRRSTVSPLEEYALRPGAVRPISNELAAAILSRKGRAEVTLKGIVIDRTDMGGRNTYWHPDSILCNDLAARERKLFYVVNIHQKDICHILDETGRYLESLPIKERPEVLNTAQQAAVAAQHQRQINRAAARLQQLHTPDTERRLAELAANATEMQRVVQTMPAPHAQPAQPARSSHGEAAAAGARRINDMRANAASAIAIGRAIALNRQSSPVRSEDDQSSEDWTSPRETNPRQTNLTQIESW